MASLPKRPPNFHAVHSIIMFVFVIILPFVSSFDSAVARASPATQTVAKQSEAVALLMWKASLDNQSQSLLSSWNEGSSYCTWVGIGCNEATKVTDLTLESIGLRGTLSSLNFSSLPHLVKLDLSNNLIYGTIPSQIGSLSRLTSLDVSINLLSGTIPRDIGMLRSLVDLDLSTNNLTGSIPSSIGNLRNLTRLILFENSLSGSIPQEVGMPRSLVDLELATNNLTGSIPASIGNLKNLTTLYLFENSLSGSIPQEIGMLTSLTDLALNTNNLTGSIPASLGNLRDLTTLYLYGIFVKDVLDKRLPLPRNQVEEAVVLAVKLALACLRHNPRCRPTMHQVSAALSKQKSRLQSPFLMITLGQLLDDNCPNA